MEMEDIKARDVRILADKIDGLVKVSIETSSSVSALTKVSNEASESIMELTKAVTVLVTQTGNFEQQRIEDHKRMDKMESNLEMHKKDCRESESNLYKTISKLKEKVDTAMPILSIVIAVITAVLVAAFARQ